MTPKQIMRHFSGAQQEVASEISRSQSTLNDWIQSGKVPMSAQLEIEILTKGKLKADLPMYFRKQML